MKKYLIFLQASKVFCGDETITFVDKGSIKISIFGKDIHIIDLESPKNLKVKQLNIDEIKKFTGFTNEIGTFDIGDLMDGKQFYIKHFYQKKDGNITYEDNLQPDCTYDIVLQEIEKIKDCKVNINGKEINLKEKYLDNCFNFNRVDYNDNLNDFYNNFKISGLEMNKKKFVLLDYKVDNVLHTMNEGESFSDYIEAFKDNVFKNKTELNINYYFNENDIKIKLSDDLEGKFNFNFSDYKDNEGETFLKKVVDILNKKNNGKLSDEQITNLIKDETTKDGFDITTKFSYIERPKNFEGFLEDEIIYSEDLYIEINDLKDFKEEFKDCLYAKKTIIEFRTEGNLVFDDNFKNKIELDYSKDNINYADMTINEYLKNNFSNIPLEKIKLKYKFINDEEEKFEDIDIIKNNYGLNDDYHYLIILSELYKGITKEVDKSKFYIKLKFEVENNKDYELNDKIKSIPNINNNLELTAKVSDLKSYIETIFGETINNYVLKENDAEVNSDKKLENDATYTFIFKDNSNCVNKKVNIPPKDKEENNNDSTKNDKGESVNENNKEKGGCCNCYKKQ